MKAERSTILPFHATKISYTVQHKNCVHFFMLFDYMHVKWIYYELMT